MDDVLDLEADHGHQNGLSQSGCGGGMVGLLLTLGTVLGNRLLRCIYDTIEYNLGAERPEVSISTTR